MNFIMTKLNIYITLCLLITVIYVGGKSYEDKELEAWTYLNDFEDDKTQYVDPHDMVNGPIPKSSKSKPVPEEIPKYLDVDNPNEKYILNVKEDLEKCNLKSHKFESDLKKQKLLSQKLQNEMLEKHDVDTSVFYRRLVQKFWSLLQMDDVTKGSTHSRYLHVDLNSENVAAFRNFIEKGENIQEIDNFFFNNINFETRDWEKYSIFYSVFRNFLTFEDIINFLSILLIFLGLWAFFLFIVDIQRELKWKKVFIMMFMIVFVISCFWHWRHMIKLNQMKDHKGLIKKELCSETIWDRWMSIVGIESSCEQFYDNIGINPSDEISPLMAVSQTFSLFLLQPLESFGINIGKFFKAYFTEIPWYYQLQATIVFVIIFMFVVLTFFNYGIQFPFWLGSIKPFSVHGGNNPEMHNLLKETMKQQQEDKALFMKEARDMLISISQTALAFSDSNTSTRQILETSPDIIERQLERIVGEKFLSLNKDERGAVSTIASTPLRSVSYKTDECDGKLGQEGTSAVHPRLKKCHNSTNDHQTHGTSIFSKTLIKADHSDEKSLCNSTNNKGKNSTESTEFLSKVREVLEKSSHNCEIDNCDYSDLSNRSQDFLSQVETVLTP